MRSVVGTPALVQNQGLYRASSAGARNPRPSRSDRNREVILPAALRDRAEIGCSILVGRIADPSVDRRIGNPSHILKLSGLFLRGRYASEFHVLGQPEGR